jgi:hypothetical protein
MRLKAICIVWFFIWVLSWKISCAQPQSTTTPSSTNTGTPPQPQSKTDVDGTDPARDVAAKRKATIESIQKQCKYNENETDNKKRQKANECISKAIRTRRQSIRVNDMLFATAHTQALREESINLGQPISPDLWKPFTTLDAGASAPGSPNPGQGTPQAFTGGSLTGTPTTCGTPGNGINNPALIRVHRAVMTPQVAMDDFGRRLGMGFVVFQVTVENGSKDYQFMLQDVSIDFSKYFHQTAGTYSYSASSQDLTLLRGVPEKGADLDRRNAFLHVLQGIGSVAGAVSGLTDFADVMGSSVAVFNGPFLQGYTSIAPDHTGTQLNRLSDSAFLANTVIDKQRAKTIAMFVPADELMSKGDQKEFRKDPNKFLGFGGSQQALNEADVCVDGTFIQAVTVAAPTLSSAVLEKTADAPAANQDRVLDITGSNLVAGDSVVVLNSADGTTARAAVATLDGKKGTAQVHLPTGFSLDTTTATLQSTLSPSLNSGAGIKITVAAQ